MKKIQLHDFEVAYDWVRKCYAGDIDAMLTFSDFLEDKGYIDQAQILRAIKPIDRIFEVKTHREMTPREALIKCNVVPTLIEPFYCPYFCLMKFSNVKLLCRYIKPQLKVKKKSIENYACIGKEYTFIRSRFDKFRGYLDWQQYNFYVLKDNKLFINQVEFIVDEDQDFYEQIAFGILGREIGFEKAQYKYKEFAKFLKKNKTITFEGVEIKKMYICSVD